MKLSTFIAAITWSSLIVLIWLMLLGRIDVNVGTVTAGIFFFMVAGASSIQSNVPEKPKDPKAPIPPGTTPNKR
jgi:hypothetical protein